MRVAAALSLALLALTAGPRAQLRPLTLDIVVSDRQGRSVESLAAADFSVRAGDATLPVGSAELVRAGGASDTGVRQFVIFLDEFHVTAGPGADRARAALLDFVRDALGPRDGLAVVKPLDTLADIRLTENRDAALQAIEAFAPRRGDFAPRTPFERNFIAGTQARVAEARTQIVLSGLHASIAELSRQAPARKTLIWLSEGMETAPAIRTGGVVSTMRGLADAANRAGIAVYPMSPLAPGAIGVDRTASGSGDGGARSVEDDLRALAASTGGRPTFEAAEVDAALRRALTDASAYYVLTLAGDPPAGGGFRDVAVSVRRPAGAALLGRTRLWVAPDEAAKPASLAPALSSFALRVPRRISPLIRPWFGMSRGDGGATRVDFVWEAAPRLPGERTAGSAPARVELSVTTMEGVQVFDGSVLPAQGAPGTERGAARASFQAPPGRLLVRMTIEDAAARVVDRDARDLVVAGFSGAISLGSAEFLRSRTAREWRELSDDPLALPAVVREFSRTERLLVRVPVFASATDITVSARLLSGFGAVMRDLAVTAVQSRAGVYQIDLPLAGLAAGRYDLDVRAVADRGEAHEMFDFRVTP